MGQCIYNIPFCGGFCAPTVNPDKSCYRHFSNEYTIPASGAFMKVGPVIEWNRCCIFCGSLGVSWAHRNRKMVMLVAFAVSLFSWALLIYPVFGLSLNPGLIRSAAWVTGEAHLHDHLALLHVYIGLRGRVDELDCKQARNQSLCEHLMDTASYVQWPFEEQGDGVYTRILSWGRNESCPDPNNGLSASVFQGPDRPVLHGHACQECRESVAETVSFAIMGIITQIPQMTTDLQRSTAFGDVNCQATLGLVTSLWGCFSALFALRSFSRSCWWSFQESTSGSAVAFEWRPGPPFYCLVVASVLKLWDAFSHLAVPTPRGRHSRPPKGVEKLEEWMELAVEQETDSEFEAVGSTTESSSEDC
mmetsp:Transcript_14015/g.44021  ORF Transcript_14015/g.44021 Transcript_14015/m.44021 type:complete len:361 (+) Transcript_14015:92-1174(+)